jgi:arsenate reductase
MASQPQRVLFVCIGNSCRSQMAEGFARNYGRDVMTVQSAGLAPASIIAPLTRDVMLEKNIRIDNQHPKSLVALRDTKFDLIVNMSGVQLPSWVNCEVVEWSVRDPIGESADVYRAVRDQIEHQVMQLILDLRSTHPGRGRTRATRKRAVDS